MQVQGWCRVSVNLHYRSAFLEPELAFFPFFLTMFLHVENATVQRSY
jgi:hypothetical protein